ncbi:MAG: hypothetical protein AB8B65_02580 [Kordia sp.]|uniref:hypothetical protein n=1 Tax=Kordia sp. TaxID=1965332 RepID=UPI00385AA8CE
MLAFTAIIGLLESILYYAILFCVGKMLNDSQQLRSFFGLKSKKEVLSTFVKTSQSVEKIGNILMLLATIGIIYSLITTCVILSDIM